MNDQDLCGLSRKLDEEAQPAHGAASMAKLPLARQRPLRLRALGQVRWILLLILDTANAQISCSAGQMFARPVALAGRRHAFSECQIAHFDLCISFACLVVLAGMQCVNELSLLRP